MDKTNRKILDEIQKDFPVCQRPFKALAERLNMDEDEVFNRICDLKARGIIRRIGASFDSRRLGWTSTLVAMKLPSYLLEKIQDIFNQYDEITHSYLRDDEYNLWFTVIAPSKKRISSILSEIEEKTGISEMLNLPALQRFKVEAIFRLRR
ncbi:MAG: AsnC family transcriptional regulator [bacterium]|nr:AsnC family transcriptional regulator [bacterium]